MISFRNHEKTNIYFNSGLTIVWGKNGSGKTSLLEAIHSLSIGKSFKTNNKKDLIKKGSQGFFLKGVFRNENNDRNTVSFSQNLLGNKKIIINKKEIIKRKEMLGLNNVVVFSPEEAVVIEGPAGERRKYFNRIFSICSPFYLENLLSYNKTLKQRNALLKIKNPKKDVLSAWDKPLSVFGEKLWVERKKEIEAFGKIFKKTAKSFESTLKAEIKYKNKIKNKSEITTELYRTQEEDIKRGFTSLGPHRDDFLFFWEKKPIRKHGSQGENKLFLALLKITEHIYVSKKTKTTPVFLIDDMFASLDKEKSRKILNFISDLHGSGVGPPQTIITTTELVNLGKNKKFSKNKNITKHQMTQSGTA